MNAGLAEILWTAQAAGFFVVLFASATTDALERRVDNRVVAAGALAGVVLWTIRGVLAGAGLDGLYESLRGGAAGFALFFAFYWLGGLGAGDVKLMAAVGALTNWRYVLYATICTAFVGAALAVAHLAVRGGWRDALQHARRAGRRERREAVAEADPKRTLPYAVAICLGSLWAVYEYVERYGGTYPWG